MIVKTAVQQQWNIMQPDSPHFIVYEQAPVDGTMWYTIKCSRELSVWIKTQLREQWYEHPYIQPDRYTFHQPSQIMFDVHQELLVMLKLTWS